MRPMVLAALAVPAVLVGVMAVLHAREIPGVIAAAGLIALGVLIWTFGSRAEARLNRSEHREHLLEAELEQLRRLMAGDSGDSNAHESAANRQRNALHFAQTPIGIIEWDQHHCVLDWNRGAEKIFGWSRDEVIGKGRLEFLVPDASREHVREVWGVLLTQKIAVKSGNENMTRDGRVIFCEWVNTPLIDVAGELVGVTSLVQDVTQRRAEEQAVHRMAYHDALTGLPNRALMYDRLEQTLKQSRRGRSRAAVVFVDLDRFKEVNDTMGHDAGDELLQQIAQRLAESVREGDTVARIGGDEFVLVLSDIHRPDDDGRAAEKLQRALAKPVLIRGKSVEVTASIGVSIYPEHGNSGETLLKHADMAMYQSKQTGRNSVGIYSPDLVGAEPSGLEAAG